MDTFRKYLNKTSKLSSEEWTYLMQIAKVTSFKRDEHIAYIDAPCDEEIFIEDGIIRAYILDDDGNERTTAFYDAGSFMSTSTLRTRNGRSLHFYQALCTSQILFFPSKDIKSFLSKSKHLSIIGKTIKDTEIDRLFRRDNCLIQVKARNRYMSFIEQYPALESKISQKHIASYLGITPVSLSRIKTSIKKQLSDNN